MEFNPNKCAVIKIKPKRNKIILLSTYQLHGQTLETTPESKYLGVTITDNLSWSSHVKNTAENGNKTDGFLRKNFRKCTPKVKEATYNIIIVVCP